VRTHTHTHTHTHRIGTRHSEARTACSDWERTNSSRGWCAWGVTPYIWMSHVTRMNEWVMTRTNSSRGWCAWGVTSHIWTATHCNTLQHAATHYSTDALEVFICLTRLICICDMTHFRLHMSHDSHMNNCHDSCVVCVCVCVCVCVLKHISRSYIWVITHEMSHVAHTIESFFFLIWLHMSKTRLMRLSFMSHI